jgi:hypothetical protein
LRTLNLKLLEPVLDSPTNVDALRHMPHLRSLDGWLSPASMTLLLQSPHALQLEKLYVHSLFTAENGNALTQLPSLTDLGLVLGSPHADFLRKMPHLRILELSSPSPRVPQLFDADRIMHALHSLSGLTALLLYGDARGAVRRVLRYTAAHLAACLPHMPLLTRLEIVDPTAVDSLHFLSSGPITRSLQSLELWDFNPRLSQRELLHVHALSSLSSLRLMSVFDRPLDDYSLLLYTPPSSPLLPSLLHFEHNWAALPLPVIGADDADNDEEEDEADEEGEEEGDEEEE